MPHGRGIAILQSGSLNEKNGENAFVGVNPALRTEGSTVAIATGGKHFRDADRLADDGKSVTPTHSVGKARRDPARLQAGHGFHCFFTQELLPVPLSLAEHHLIELGEVCGRGVKAAGGYGMFRPGFWAFEDEIATGNKFTILRTVDHGKPCELIFARVEGRVGHSQWLKQTFLQEIFKALAGNYFHNATEGVDAGVAICPLCPWFKLQGLLGNYQCRFRQGAVSAAVQIAESRGVTPGQARGVSEQIVDRDRPAGLFENQLVVAAVSDQQLPAEFGQMFFDEVCGREFPFIGEHHDGDCRDRFCHRCDFEKRILGHRLLRFQVTVADGFMMQNRVGGTDNSDSTGEFSIGDELLHSIADGC